MVPEIIAPIGAVSLTNLLLLITIPAVVVSLKMLLSCVVASNFHAPAPNGKTKPKLTRQPSRDGLRRRPRKDVMESSNPLFDVLSDNEVVGGNDDDDDMYAQTDSFGYDDTMVEHMSMDDIMEATPYQEDADVYEASDWDTDAEHFFNSNGVHDELVKNELVLMEFFDCLDQVTVGNNVANQAAMIDFSKSVASRVNASQNHLVTCVVLIRRIISTSPQLRVPCGSGHRVFVVVLLIVSKMLDDNGMSNKEWTTITTEFSNSELNLLEVEILSLLDFRLFVSSEEFVRTSTEILES